MRLSVVMLLALIPTAALAHDASEQFADWYKSLRQTPSGGDCCGMADCRVRQVRAGPSPDVPYEVLNNGQWLPVPRKIISPRSDNPTGDFVSCVHEQHWKNGLPDPEVLCFVRRTDA